MLKDEAAKRRGTLKCLRAAMTHLGAERPRTTDEYAAARSELGLPWSMQRILRLWKSFELAAQAAAGAARPRTWQQRDFTRRFLARRPGRAFRVDQLAVLAGCAEPTVYEFLRALRPTQAIRQDDGFYALDPDNDLADALILLTRALRGHRRRPVDLPTRRR